MPGEDVEADILGIRQFEEIDPQQVGRLTTDDRAEGAVDAHDAAARIGDHDAFLALFENLGGKPQAGVPLEAVQGIADVCCHFFQQLAYVLVKGVFFARIQVESADDLAVPAQRQ